MVGGGSNSPSSPEKSHTDDTAATDDVDATVNAQAEADAKAYERAEAILKNVAAEREQAEAATKTQPKGNRGHGNDSDNVDEQNPGASTGTARPADKDVNSKFVQDDGDVPNSDKTPLPTGLAGADDDEDDQQEFADDLHYDDDDDDDYIGGGDDDEPPSQVSAVFDFDAEEPGELTLRVGDEVRQPAVLSLSSRALATEWPLLSTF